MECENDIRAVALAILRGVVSPEEGRSAVFGRTEPRPVSESLHLGPEIVAEARGPLPAEAAGLFKSLFDQPDPAALVAEDETLAKLLVAQQLISPEQAEECLAIQRRLLEMGFQPAPRLGDLLVRKGFLAPGRLASELPEQTPQEALVAQKDPANCVGRYVRTRKLGEGGMGEVWRAWDRDLSRWVALKFLKGKDREELARFRREAQTAAKLSHPNIAAVYEAQDSFIAMQLVEGQTLATFPRDNAREIVQIVREVALALHHAHELGVIHRDVKPENVMVEGANPLRVWVMDFGLAKQTTVEAKLSASGMIVGTPAYMSPEQAIGQRVDRRGDVYSLGATLYELLTDRPPFVADDLYHTIRKILELDPKPVKRDADLNTIVLKCLEKDPARRYATAQELADDLGRWLHGDPLLAHPPSTLYRLRKKVARNPWAWSLAGAAAMAMIIGLAAVVYLLSRDVRKARANELILRVERLYNDDRIDEVRPLIEEALRIDPGNAEAKYWRSRLLLREYMQRRGVPEARVIRGLLEILPSRPETEDERKLREKIEAGFGNQPFARGTIALWSGDYELAIAEFAKIRRDSPASWEADFYTGVAYYLRGEFESARAELAKCKPTQVYVRCLLGCGQAAELRGDDDTAHARYALAEGLADEDPILWSQVRVLRGKFELSRGREPNFDRAIERVRDRTEPEARAALGDAWMAQAEHRRFLGRLDLDDPVEYRNAIEAYGDGEPLRRAEAHLARYDVLQPYGRIRLDDLQRARDDFERALRERPKLLDAAIGLAIAERELRTSEGVRAYQEAVDRLTALLREHPDHVTVLLARANARGHLAYALEREKRDPIPEAERAVEDFKRALELRPGSSETCLQLGVMINSQYAFHRSRGEERPAMEIEAVEYLSKALQANPKDYRARMQRAVVQGNVLFQNAREIEPTLERYRELLKEFDRALEVNPKHVETLRMRAVHHLQLGSFEKNLGRDPSSAYDEAKRDLERVARINAADPYVWCDLADLHRCRGEWARDQEWDETPFIDESLACCDRALALNPRFAKVLCMRGKARSWRATRTGAGIEEHDLALRDLDAAIEVEFHPTYYFHRSEIRYNRLGVLRELGRESREELERALEDVLVAMKHEDGYDIVHYQAGVVRLDRARLIQKEGGDAPAEYARAEKHFSDAIARNETFAKAYLYRGIIRVIQGRKKEARSDFLNALDLRPSLRPTIEPWLKKCEEAK